jgi:hypothetical protein
MIGVCGFGQVIDRVSQTVQLTATRWLVLNGWFGGGFWTAR